MGKKFFIQFKSDSEQKIWKQNKEDLQLHILLNLFIQYMFHSSSTAQIKLKMVVISSRPSTSFLQCYNWEKCYQEKSNVVQKSCKWWSGRLGLVLKSNPVLLPLWHFPVVYTAETITVFVCSAVILLLTGSYFHWRIMPSHWL